MGIGQSPLADVEMNAGFWKGKSVFLTGHTGFKGAWTALLLRHLGAEVHGFALPPETDPALFDLLGADLVTTSTFGDLTDQYALDRAVADARADIVLHMAAQPLVRRSYREPVQTFATNVMGTVHLLEAIHSHEHPLAVLVVTSDKVYRNFEDGRAFVEGDRLGGHDPYAASKAATEIAVESFRVSYFEKMGVALATARGGNVIAGGDWSPDRLIPDIVRTTANGSVLKLRNPRATRPWQHALDCLSGYLVYIERLASGAPTPTALNFGPQDPADVMNVANVQAAFARAAGLEGSWETDGEPGPREMTSLAIDSSAASEAIGWQAKLSSREAVEWTARWYAKWLAGEDMRQTSVDQIEAFIQRPASGEPN